MVLAVVSLLVVLVLPALAVRDAMREPSRDFRAVCLHRMSQLANALALYAADNRDYLPPNDDEWEAPPGLSWFCGNVGDRGSAEFNPDVLRDPRRALLAPYLGNNISAYKCPLDQRVGKYQGTNPALRGQIPSVRTVSLNGVVGTNPRSTSGKKPVDGPWLDGNHTLGVNGKIWYCYAQTSDFVWPGPASTFTFVEEDPLSLNEGAFSCMGPNAEGVYKMVDWPLTYHGMAGALAFADGHVEMHRWVDDRTPLVWSAAKLEVQAHSRDLDWIARHATARINP